MLGRLGFGKKTKQEETKKNEAETEKSGDAEGSSADENNPSKLESEVTDQVLDMNNSNDNTASEPSSVEKKRVFPWQHILGQEEQKA